MNYQKEHRIYQALSVERRMRLMRILTRMAHGKRAPAAFTRIIDLTYILACLLILVFPPGLSYTVLAIGAGYIFAVNLEIARVCWERMDEI